MRYTKKSRDFGYLPNNVRLKDLYCKLGQLEDIEEELGIDLITLFKALKEGFYFKDDFGDIIHFEKELLQSLIKGKVHDLKKELKDYGKTWTLTKEELE